MMRRPIIKTTIAAATVCGLSLHIGKAAAAPNVTAVPIGTSCTSYPGFDGSNAGPFIAVADSTGRAVDGIGLNAAYFVEGTHRYGYVSMDLFYFILFSSPLYMYIYKTE